MRRTPFHRDFNIAKAALLAVLMAAAFGMGEVPHVAGGQAAQERPAPERIVPAILIQPRTEFGVSL